MEKLFKTTKCRVVFDVKYVSSVGFDLELQAQLFGQVREQLW